MEGTGWRRVLDRLNTPWAPTVVTGILFALYIVLRLQLAYQGDVSGFITAGDRHCNPTAVPRNLRVIPNSDGYDGEFYYRLALDPFTAKPEEWGIVIDAPSYRQQRILYPLLVWALSLGGNPALVPLMMLLVNYVSMCLIAWLAAVYVRSMGQHALWALAVVLYPGLLLSVSRNLLEPLQICLLLAALVLARRGGRTGAALVLCAAVFTRETALLAAVALLAANLYRSRRSNWYVFLLPIALYGLWMLFLQHHWGEYGFRQGLNAILRWPGQWLVEFMAVGVRLEDLLTGVWFTELCFMVIFTVGVALSLRSSVATTGVKWAWLLYAALAAFLPNPVAGADWGFMRALSEFYVIGALILIGSQLKAKVIILPLGTAVWWLVFVHRVGVV